MYFVGIAMPSTVPLKRCTSSILKKATQFFINMDVPITKIYLYISVFTYSWEAFLGIQKVYNL
jgi:hypothetical protein